LLDRGSPSGSSFYTALLLHVLYGVRICRFDVFGNEQSFFTFVSLQSP
jgi:hypothetical protein